MSNAVILAAALNDGAFGGLENAYLHRARREDSLGEIVGREALIADDIALAASIGPVEVVGFTPSVITITGTAFRQHRWSEREGERILRQWVVSDREVPADQRAETIAAMGAAHPAQPPLGEVRSGRGQLAAGATAWFSGPHQPLLDALHRVWNGRRLDLLSALYTPDALWSGPGGRSGNAETARGWLLVLLARLPDATMLFDRVEADGDRLAILWRLFGHVGGRRVRLVGSSLMLLDADNRIAEDDTLIDELALDATAHRPLQAILR